VADRSGARPAAPHAWTWLSQQPRVAICRQFASAEECAHLLNKFAGALTPASEYRRGNSANEEGELQYFNGRGFPAGPLDTDSVTRMLERRLSAMTQWPIERFEPCSFVSYRPGEEYRPHVDYFTDEQIVANEQLKGDFGGQRIATFLLYLRAPEEGGETCYLHPGVHVTGETGMGVLHYNVTASGEQDRASIHSGKPIVRGEKWLWRSTLRQRSLYERQVP
jgi:prolyl 4-hydroxylase